MAGGKRAGARRFAWSHRLLLAGAGASVLVLLGVATGFVILLSGTFNTSATEQHSWLTHRLLEAGLLYSVRSSAEDVVAPPGLDEPGVIARGAACYDLHCAQCHDAPGVARAAEGKGMMPIPSSLAEAARTWPPEWLYVVTQKGVRMTGMPAWEFRLADESLWATVAFLKTLPRLTAADYRERVAAADATACPVNDESPAGYSAERSKILLAQYGCQSCHRIEGIVGPLSHVGPPLVDWSRQKYVAGVLPNTAENLVRWIVDPQSVSPQTQMPDLGVAEPHAREMADYLLTLR
jgi:mono/diheme cytochrome c family protein